MKLCTEIDAYFISKFHILEIERWNPPLRVAYLTAPSNHLGTTTSCGSINHRDFGNQSCYY
jgi:hypothetical protein